MLQEAGGNPVYAYLNGPSEFQFSGALRSLDLRAVLPTIRVPTLVTCGEYNEAPPSVGRIMARQIGGASFAGFRGLSHMAHIEDPLRVVGRTRSFLDGIA